MVVKSDIKTAKFIAIVSYFYLLGVLVAYLANADKKSHFAYFHIRQSLGLWCTFLILGYPVGYFDNWNITIAFWIAFGVQFIYGFSTAISNQTVPIPLVGKFYQKVFKNIK